MNEHFKGVALARGGVFTATQAAALGATPTDLSRWVRSGLAVRVRRDAYILRDAWEPGSPEERLALRARAVLATRGTDIASHQSALALHRLPLHGVDLESVDVLTDVDRRRTRRGLRRHPLSGLSHVVADGYRCVLIADAIAQVTVRSGLVAGMVPFDAALHAERVSVAEVADALKPLCTTRRLRDRGDALLAQCDSRCESPGETRARLLLHDLGFTDVRSQAVVRDEGEFVARVDFLVSGRVIVEFDGAVKYGGDGGRDALIAEKRREDDLRRLGYVVLRLTWADLAHPERVSRLVRQALSLATRQSA